MSVSIFVHVYGGVGRSGAIGSLMFMSSCAVSIMVGYLFQSSDTTTKWFPFSLLLNLRFLCMYDE